MRDGPRDNSTVVSLEETEDARWVAATLAGDLTAFDRLIGRYQRRALSVAYRLLGSVDDASDVCQEAFLRAFRSLDTLDVPGRFAAWLMRIVCNLSLNYRRGRKKHLALSTDDGGDGEPTDGVMHQPAATRTPTPDREAVSGEMDGAIGRALEALPEKQRLALVLFAIEGLPQKDVAEALEMSVEAVKWNVFQARKTLRETLAEYLEE
ncbi:MAG: sigma-70 family RNA polymerase sigma factor [Phycisphaerae bacterium]